MSASPTWLTDDETAEANVASPPRVPHPPVTPPTTERGRAALKEAGLDFLVDDGAAALAKNDSHSNAKAANPSPAPPSLSGSPIPVSPTVTLHKKGALIEDESFTSKSTTNAPVHFLKRMQQAETVRSEKKGPHPPSTPDKHTSSRVTPQRKQKPSVSPKPRNVNAAQQRIGELEEQRIVDLSVIPELTAEDCDRYDAIIKYFGLHTCKLLASTRFQHRCDGHRAVSQKMDEEFSGKSVLKPFYDAASQAVLLGLKDPVIAVFTTTASALRSFLESHQSNSAFDLKMFDELDLIVGEIVKRLKETNVRCRDGCTSSLNAIARRSESLAFVVLQSVCYVSAASPTSSMTTPNTSTEVSTSVVIESATEGFRSTLAKIEFCEAFLESHPKVLKEHWQTVMAFVAQHLNSSNNKVRKHALSLCVTVHPIAGRSMEHYLVQVNPATIKLLRQELGDGEHVSAEDMLKPAVPTLDQAEIRQEEDDITAFNGETKLSLEKEVLTDLWSQSLNLKSAKCIFSSRWKIRERLVERIGNLIVSSSHATSAPSRTLNLKCSSVAQSLAQIFEVSLQDTVPAVVTATFRSIRAILPYLIPISVPDFMQPLLPLFAKSQNGSGPQQELMNDSLRSFCEFPSTNLNTVISQIAAVQEATSGDVGKVPLKLAVGRLELIFQVIWYLNSTNGINDEAKLTTNPFASKSVDEVLTFEICRQYLDHPQAKVRAAACNVIVELYSRNSAKIEPLFSTLRENILNELKSRTASVAQLRGANGTSVAKAQRLFNFMKPLGDANNASNTATDTTTTSVRQRVKEYQNMKQQQAAAADGTLDDLEARRKEEEAKKDLEKISGVNVASMGKATPGKKSRLVFA